MSIFNFGKDKTLGLKLNCRQAGLELHDRLIANDWQDLGDEKGQKPTFHKPYTRYDKKYGKCLLLTGYSFILEDEHGREEREVVKVIDVTSGKIIEELRFGWGHKPGALKGKRNKNEVEIASDDEEMARHRQLFGEFTAE
jgi:hypothetical protein